MCLRALCFFFYLAGITSHAAQAPWAGKISHVVVLMEENRSFDHLVGMMKKDRPEIDGCLPSMGDICTNPINPSDPLHSPKVPVGNGALYVQPADPDHSVSGTTFEIFSTHYPSSGTEPSMKGFVKQYAPRDHHHANGTFIMECFDPPRVPVITTLANEFVLFDRWFCDVPGPTDPNRMYAFIGTSSGMGSNTKSIEATGFAGNISIFEMLDSEPTRKNTWGVYFNDTSTALFVDYVRKHVSNVFNMTQFYQQIADGTLPTFSWLDPRWTNTDLYKSDNQHPDNDVTFGEVLYKNIYEALRNGPKWNETLFILTYDEHGGFFDHVSPPKAVNPDGKSSVDISPPFNFDRYGIRIPTVMMSPWIPKGLLAPRPTSNEDPQWSASSLAATLRKMFAPSHKPLTKRTAGARTFDEILSLSEPRTDCPKTLPDPPKSNFVWSEHQGVHDYHVDLINMMQPLCGASDEDVRKLTSQQKIGKWFDECMKIIRG